ncbi:MAG: peptidase C11 [Firmicutes bacterium]|nr:peptidase C11 [Bacillota bacterium]
MPREREKNITGQGKEVYKRGEDLGTGPVGKQEGYQGRPTEAQKEETQQRPTHASVSGLETKEKGETFRRASSSGGFQSNQTETRAVPTKSGGLFSGRLIKFLLIALVVYMLIRFLFPGGSVQPSNQGNTDPTPSQSGQTVEIPFNYSTVTNTISSSTISGGWSQNSNSGKLDTSVDSSARAKYTKLKGNGNDTVTLMIYMCGADLESRSGLGTSDIVEMTKAEISDKVNVIIYCGGTTRWQNDVLSAKTNQIIQVLDGGQVAYLSKDEGNVCMTKPATLTGFIKDCVENFPADRYQLILWDHGSGSLAGYGYDEKFTSSGTMGLAGINQALKDAGVKFDFIGFDACLMATAETGLMLSQYADYMIASEEVEAGYGWYYTDWLTSLSRNTSIPTVQLGKDIVDDFIDSCAKQVPGQKATLSVVDLAELSATMPKELKSFATSTYNKIKEDYNTVATARSSTREFSTQSIDQVDLVNLALNMKSTEGSDLAKAILGAVKYNRVSSNMTNAYGLSIYFPYKKASSVKTAVSTYEAIGMEDEYSRCIQAFAGVTGTGQTVQQNLYPESTGGGYSLLEALFSDYGGSSSQGSYPGGSSSQQGGYSMDSQEMQQLIGTLLESLLSDRSVVTAEEATDIVRSNIFDASKLVWTQGANGPSIKLTGNQWSLVRDLCLNVWYDVGDGYVDLGLDNVFHITEDGELLGDYDGTWIAINQQPVAYYYLDSYDDGTNYAIYGRIPALLNGDRVNILVVYNNANPHGLIAGANFDYSETGVEAIAKNLVEIKDGDVIDFICDCYDYSGNYSASYKMGDQLVVNGALELSDVYLARPDAAQAAYIFTDVFGQEFWTPIVPH